MPSNAPATLQPPRQLSWELLGTKSREGNSFFPSALPRWSRSLLSTTLRLPRILHSNSQYLLQASAPTGSHGGSVLLELCCQVSITSASRRLWERRGNGTGTSLAAVVRHSDLFCLAQLPPNSPAAELLPGIHNPINLHWMAWISKAWSTSKGHDVG